MSPLRITTIHPARIVSTVGICLVGLLFIVYALFQARLLLTGPQIWLTQEPSLVQTTRTITLQGQAENIVAIELNGRSIVTDEQGNFNEAVVLENGYTIVRIEARDRYGRETALERSFVFTPRTLLPTNT